MPEEEVAAQLPLTAVSVKLPSFWTDSPEVWFLQAEAQFENKGITVSRTKFTHCVAALPQDFACRLLDLVRAPLLILLQLLEDASSRCILSVIFNVIRLYRVYPCCPTSAPQS